MRYVTTTTRIGTQRPTYDVLQTLARQRLPIADPGIRGVAPAAATVLVMATREDLHRKVDTLSETQLKQARIILVDEVDEETSVKSILARHGERRLSTEKFEDHFGDLPRDGEG